jgi:anti-sigma B factor antagonist
MAQTVSFSPDRTAAFSSDRIDERTQVLTPDGKCDFSTALEAEQRILAALDAGRTEIIFDLRGVSSLGSSLLHVLLRGLIQTKGRNGRLVLVRPNAYVWDVFESSGLDHAFPTFNDLHGALAKASDLPAKVSRASSHTLGFNRP